MFSEVLASTSSQTRRRRRPAAASSARSASEIRVDVLHRDRALVLDPELLQVADDHAGVLPRDVAEDHVALGLLRGPFEVDQVADRRRRLQQVEDRPCGSGDDPEMDHAGSVDPSCSRTTTCTCEPTRLARRRRRSRTRTSTATWPRRRSRIAELGVSEHLYRFAESLAIWQHSYWQDQAVDELGPCRVRGRPRCDWGSRRTTSGGGGPDRDAARRAWIRLRRRLRALPRRSGRRRRSARLVVLPDADSLWQSYFEWQAELAAQGLFDIVSHPDLVKIWGEDRPRPERDPRFHYEPFVEAVAESGSRSRSRPRGLRKPVGEIYPSRALAGDVRRGRGEFALSSDAHRIRWGSATSRRSSFSPTSAWTGSASSRDGSAASSRSASPTPTRHRWRAGRGRGLMALRVGTGYDSHRLADGESLQ